MATKKTYERSIKRAKDKKKAPQKDIPPPSETLKKKSSSKDSSRDPTESDVETLKKPFPVVGIGASAGGLEAFTDLFKHLAPNTGMGFVLIQHLEPKHENALPSILSKVTTMQVYQIKEGMKVLPNSVYVIPSDANVTIADGILHLTERMTDSRGIHMPIDVFFRSLALDYQEKAIGIVLSGASTDGTLGLYEIKSEAGITFAQDEQTAKQPGMPASAAHFGAVDFVMTPEGIAKELSTIGQYIPSVSSENTTEPVSIGEEDIRKICGLVRHYTGVDFNQYKRATITRRIQRHMVLEKKNLTEYISHLKESPKALEALAQDIPILVTHFFRDAETFEVLKTHVFPSLMEGRKPDDPVRIWVPGCSTGEEVYSIAIVFMEFLGDLAYSTPVQFFGSDISEAALQKARAGIYIDNISVDVSKERLRNYFTPLENKYQIHKQIRDACVFAKHDVTKDPPFSKIDLISCRNLLIYLQASTQRKVLSRFHYALKPHGFLSLGTSETIGLSNDLFSVSDKQNKLFTKKGSSARAGLDFTIQDHAEIAHPVGRVLSTPLYAPTGGFDLQQEFTRLLFNRYTPPCVVVNGDMEILQVHGRTASYLELPSGRVSHNLLQMARDGLGLPLRTSLQQARKTGVPVTKRNLSIREGGQKKDIDIEIVPLKSTSETEHYFVVLFHEIPTSFKETATRTRAKAGNENASEYRQMKRELLHSRRDLGETKEYLQSIIEQQEASNEELKSANEEILSSNEELQSANEEIETSKEELQSTNEELNTVNHELQNRNRDLTLLNNDLHNLLVSVKVPLVMLDTHLKIRRITPSAEEELNLVPTDVGRHISNIKINIELPDLEVLLLEVVKNGIPIEREIQNRQGTWFRLELFPYRTLEDQVQGVILAMFNIHQAKSEIEIIKTSRNYLDAIIQTVHEPLVVLDNKLRVKSANKAFFNTFQVTPEETLEHLIYELGNAQWNIPRLRTLLKEILPEKSQFDDFIVELFFPKIGKKTMRLSARPIVQEELGVNSILLIIEDVSAEKRFHELERSNAELKGFAYAASHDLQEPLRMISTYLDLVKRRTKGTLDKETADSIDYAAESARRMKSLIDDLLTYSRVGGTTRELSEINCAELLEQVERDLKAPIEESGIIITHDSLPMVRADSSQLRQVFQNVISNSIKFRDEKAPKLYISAEKRGREWIFSFRDNGIGFDMQYAEKIFDVFQRLHKKDEYPGTGIGLAICKKIIESHGGSIWAESSLGNGATFFFTLPV